MDLIKDSLETLNFEVVMLSKMFFLLFFVMINSVNSAVEIMYRIRTKEYSDYHESTYNIYIKGKKFESEFEKIAYWSNIEEKLHKEKNLQYYKSLKWGFKEPFNVWYVQENTQIEPPVNSVCYEVLEKYEGLNHIWKPFVKINGDYIYTPKSLIPKIYIEGQDSIPKPTFSRFEIINNSLILINRDSVDTLFTKGRVVKTRYGRMFHTRDYDKVNFMGYDFINVSEFYLNDELEEEGYDILFWLDSEYKLIRMDTLLNNAGEGRLFVKKKLEN